MNYKDEFLKWLNSNVLCSEEINELNGLNKDEIRDRFHKKIEFGTGGIRALMGIGINRINKYTLGMATEALCNYAKSKCGNAKILIAYDTRKKSEEYAKYIGNIISGNNMEALIFDVCTPTPILSFGVTHLKCDFGIVVTASHNPKEYNGYKIYCNKGYQITDKVANDIHDEMEKLHVFSHLKYINVENKKIHYVNYEIYDEYFRNARNLFINKSLIKDYGKDLNVIYTPLHGAGKEFVEEILKDYNLKLVNEQCDFSGDFQTVKIPNPEDENVFQLSLEKYADEFTDIIIATDPDCDRVAVLVKDRGEFKMLNGNEIGILILDYILKSNDKFENYEVISTIVSSPMIKRVCDENNIFYTEVLTGFKYIGERIVNSKYKFLFGLEESFGYLYGDFVKDKDGIIGSSLICEMALYYKKQNKNLVNVMDELYKKYGYYLTNLISLEFNELSGRESIDNLMKYIRNGKIVFGNVYKTIDYELKYNSENNIELPRANVVKFIFKDGTNITIRPSGTEPKIKIYVSVVGNNGYETAEKLKRYEKYILSVLSMKNIL